MLSVPDESYSRNVPDEGYSRNVSCALNLISTDFDMSHRHDLLALFWNVQLLNREDRKGFIRGGESKKDKQPTF